MYLLDKQTALIQTLDFFTPIVDDPYNFGQIAAANALSDVYAMGGKPLLCMNILACPVQSMQEKIFRQVVEGGLSKIREAGALLVGGHSIEDDELKYGLSVTGTVHPEHLLKNSGAQPDDVLVLTKPLGSGILSTAIKGGLGTPEIKQCMVTVMATLNKAPMECAHAERETVYQHIHAATDITGFGLLGHLHEVARASGVSIRIESSALPVMEEVSMFADMGIIPAGAYTNQKYYSPWVDTALPEKSGLEMICYDPQTSGGLLLSMEPDAADRLADTLEKSEYPFACAVIGRVEGKNERGLVVLN